MNSMTRSSRKSTVSVYGFGSSPYPKSMHLITLAKMALLRTSPCCVVEEAKEASWSAPLPGTSSASKSGSSLSSAAWVSTSAWREARLAAAAEYDDDEEAGVEDEEDIVLLGWAAGLLALLLIC